MIEDLDKFLKKFKKNIKSELDFEISIFYNVIDNDDVSEKIKGKTALTVVLGEHMVKTYILNKEDISTYTIANLISVVIKDYKEFIVRDL